MIAVACCLAALIARRPPPWPRSPGESPEPIPQDPLDRTSRPSSARRRRPTRPMARTVPRHPFMAPNGRSNLHDDAYQTDTYRWAGPLGDHLATSSALFLRECASITFDSRGRLVTICVGLDKPVLAMLDPRPLEVLATRGPAAPKRKHESVPGLLRRRLLLPRQPRPGGDLGRRTATSSWSRETGGAADPGFALERDYDVTGAVPERRRAHLGASRLARADLVRQQEGRRRGRSSPRAARCAASTPASRSATRSRSTRPAASTSSRTRPCTDSTRATGGRPSPGGARTRTSASPSRGRPRRDPGPRRR